MNEQISCFFRNRSIFIIDFHLATVNRDTPFEWSKHFNHLFLYVHVCHFNSNKKWWSIYSKRAKINFLAIYSALTQRPRLQGNKRKHRFLSQMLRIQQFLCKLIYVMSLASVWWWINLFELQNRISYSWTTNCAFSRSIDRPIYLFRLKQIHSDNSMFRRMRLACCAFEDRRQCIQ